MDLANFFSSAPFARPVVPKPVTFHAVCSERTLPGGANNPAKQTIAKVTAALTFIDGEMMGEIRGNARRALLRRAAEEAERAAKEDGKKEPGLQLASTEEDFGLELMYHMLHETLRIYDPKDRSAGAHLFVSPKQARQLLVPAEADRILGRYHEYVKAEHAEAVDPETFRDTETAGPRVAIR